MVGSLFKVKVEPHSGGVLCWAPWTYYFLLWMWSPFYIFSLGLHLSFEFLIFFFLLFQFFLELLVFLQNFHHFFLIVRDFLSFSFIMVILAEFKWKCRKVAEISIRIPLLIFHDWICQFYYYIPDQVFALNSDRQLKILAIRSAFRP